MELLRKDFRYATRQFVKHPGFTTVAVLTLALGIGANTAIFSVVNSVLLRSLPYEESDRLVAVTGTGNVRGTFAAIRDRAHSLGQVVAYGAGRDFSLMGWGTPARIEGVHVTSGFFSLLGAEAALGRTFLPKADQPGRGRVVVLSYGLWRQRFGADPQVVGREIRLEGRRTTGRFTIVGIMPPDFRFPSRDTRLWIPLTLDPGNSGMYWGAGGLSTIARLRSGVTVQQARAQVSALGPKLQEVFPWDMPEDWALGANVVPLQERIVGNVRSTLLILLGSVGLVLLIACVNLANLLLVRASSRGREFAIRTALGAGRKRLIRQLLTESVLLGMIGGAVGLVLAYVGTEFLISHLPASMPRTAEIGIDARVLGFTMGLALLTGLVFGLLPALRASDFDEQGTLKGGGRSSNTGAEHHRLSGALVVAEIALAVVLVAGAGLLIESFWERLQVDPGFRTEQIISAVIAPPEFRYDDDPARRVLYGELVQRIEALPNTRNAAVTSHLPFGESTYGSAFLIKGRPHPGRSGGEWPYAQADPVISDDYLRLMAVPLLKGRRFTGAERASGPGVVLVNESLAREYWPNQNPIGKQIALVAEPENWLTVIGVVGNVKRDTLTGDYPLAIYRPLAQGQTGIMSLVVRTTADPEAFSATLHRIVASIDEDMPVADIQTMEQLISTSVAEFRFSVFLLSAFAFLALLLGTVGVYGVTAHAVSQRTREIGVRMVLGARRPDLVRLVVGRSMMLALIGVVVGLLAAYGFTRLLSSQLYGVTATDPVTFAAVAAVLMAAALLASYIPARRATRVDPMMALRYE